MKGLKAIMLCAAVAAAMSVSAQSVDDVKAEYNTAAGLIKAKNYAEAVKSLEKVVDQGLDIPDALDVVQQAQKYLPTCYFQLGLAAAQGNDFENALTYLTKASDMGELYNVAAAARNAKTMISRVYTMMAAEPFNNKDYAKAAEIFAKGFAANDQDTDLGMNLAMSYCEMGDLAKGMNVYKQIIALGDVHSKFAPAVEQAKSKAAYYATLAAQEQVAAGNVADAYATIDTVLAMDAANADAQMLRIQTATNAKDWDKVIEWGEAAAEAQATDEAKSTAYFLLGAAYDSKDNNAKAIETYTKVTAGDNAAAAKARIAELKAL